MVVSHSMVLRLQLDGSKRGDRLLPSPSTGPEVSGFAQFSATKSKVMVGPEGRRFRQEINMLAGGSPTLFPRILSYGLANRKTMDENSYWLRDIDDGALSSQPLPPGE